MQASVGARLKAARLARGGNLADIAKETRVPQRHLLSLESDAYEKLPALPYTVGFVKSFAKAVGLPPEEIAAQYRAENGATSWTPQLTHFEPVDDRRVPPRGVIFAALGLLLLLVILATGYAVGWFDSDQAPPPPATEAAPQTTASPEETAPAQPLAPPVSTPPSAVAPAAATAPAQPIAAETAMAGAPLAQGPVVIRATADAWIKISADAGRTTVKMGILRAGEQYQVPNMAGLTLWTGKAGALDVRVGGRRVAPLGGPEQTVRNVSLEPADLLARTN